MTASPADLDLVAVSYVAQARILRVATYPEPNGGTPVREVIPSVAADGVIVAMAASALGYRAGLVSNDLGSDPAGSAILSALARSGVEHRLGLAADAPTPELTIVTDDLDTRTWFAHLGDASNSLERADFGLLSRARLAYIDCYAAISAGATRAIGAAADRPIMLNLGGDNVANVISHAVTNSELVAVQTSLDESEAHQAFDLALLLQHEMRPRIAIVTIGRLGAVARSEGRTHKVAAHPVDVRHTHGAGAAFSAGFALDWLAHQDHDSALQAGCDAGTARCAAVPVELGARPVAEAGA